MANGFVVTSQCMCLNQSIKLYTLKTYTFYILGSLDQKLCSHHKQCWALIVCAIKAFCNLKYLLTSYETPCDPGIFFLGRVGVSTVYQIPEGNILKDIKIGYSTSWVFN